MAVVKVKLWAFFALLIVVAVGVLLYSNSVEPDHVEVASRGSSAVTRLPSDTANPPVIAAASDAVGAKTVTPKTPQNWKTSKLFLEYSNAHDLRVFAEKAKRMPGSGGVFYASRALAECRTHSGEGYETLTSRAAKEISSTSDPKLRDARQAAMTWTHDRCKTFTASELGVLENRNLKNSREAKEDPVWTMEEEIYKNDEKLRKDPTLKRALVEKLLTSQDPALLEQVERISASLDKASQLNTNYVDKVPYGGLDSETFDLAWQLMTCKITDTCDSLSSSARYLCAYQGICGESTYSTVKAAGGTQFVKIEQVANRLAQIISEANVDALVLRKAP